MLYPYLLAVFLSMLATPTVSHSIDLSRRADVRTFEWTALGDSWASGIGAGLYVDGSRCLRYDGSYPHLMDININFPSGSHIFNNVVCAGAKTGDVETFQLGDVEVLDKPDWTYGKRPKFGNPMMATLSVGWENIDFPGVIRNCILQLTLDGYPAKSCDDQRKDTWTLLNSTDLTVSISKTIQAIVAKGQLGLAKEKFHLFVTGYSWLFNASDTACNAVTFASPPNTNSLKMTQELREDFNQMILKLNEAIKLAVNQNSLPKNVFYVPVDYTRVNGHRFCEPNVVEPSQKNENLWFFQYPYDETADAKSAFDTARIQLLKDKTAEEVKIKWPSQRDFENAIYEALPKDKFASSDVANNKAAWSAVGNRAKAFHPKIPIYEFVRELTIDVWSWNEYPVPTPLQCSEYYPRAPKVSASTLESNIHDFCVASQEGKTLKETLIRNGTGNYTRSFDFTRGEGATSVRGSVTLDIKWDTGSTSVGHSETRCNHMFNQIADTCDGKYMPEYKTIGEGLKAGGTLDVFGGGIKFTTFGILILYSSSE